MFQAFQQANRVRHSIQKPDTPAFLQRYFRQKELNRRLDTSVRDLRFVVLDAETTGLNVHTDQLLTLGAVVVQGGEIRLGESLEIVIAREANEPMQGAEIHGLTCLDMKYGLSLSEALAQTLDFLGPDVLVGQHIGFDAAMIEAAVARHFMSGFQLYNKRIDTAHLAYKVEHPSAWRHEMLQPARYNLDALCERFKVPIVGRHTACGDALATAELFLKLQYRMEKQGRRTLRQFMG